MFAPPVIAAMQDHAERVFPEEACGLVVAGAYVRCVNVAEDPADTFTIAPEVLLPHLQAGDLDAVIHSHPAPHPPAPSLTDMRAQIDLAVPWGIVPVGEEGDAAQPFFWGDGAPIPPLLERPYRHGVTDCYSVIHDWYRLERGLVLPDYPRAWGWWQAADHPDLYVRYLTDAGFRDIDPADATTGDGLLLQVGAVVSHAAVLCAPGVMLHHPAGGQPYDPTRLSKRDAVSR